MVVMRARSGGGHPASSHLGDGRQGLVSIVHRYGGQGGVLLAVHGVGWRQALALVLGGGVVRKGLVAGGYVLRLEGG